VTVWRGPFAKVITDRWEREGRPPLMTRDEVIREAFGEPFHPALAEGFDVEAVARGLGWEG
jgi:hypothetical protein